MSGAEPGRAEQPPEGRPSSAASRSPDLPDPVAELQPALREMADELEHFVREIGSRWPILLQGLPSEEICDLLREAGTLPFTVAFMDEVETVLLDQGLGLVVKLQALAGRVPEGAAPSPAVRSREELAREIWPRFAPEEPQA